MSREFIYELRKATGLRSISDDVLLTVTRGTAIRFFVSVKCLFIEVARHLGL